MPTLFRKEALKNIHHPEELDSVIKLTMPVGWISVITILVLIVLIVLWSIFGRLSFRVQGLGVIHNLGTRIYDVTNTTEGVIQAVYVHDGDIVTKDSVMATVALPEVSAQLMANQAMLDDLTRQQESLSARSQQEISVREQSTHNQIKTLHDKIESSQEQYEFFDQLYQDQLEELELGYITRLQLDNTQSQRNDAEFALKDAVDQVENLEVELLAFKNQQAVAMNQLHQQVVQTQGQIDTLKTSLTENTAILSPVDGLVNSSLLKPNMQVAANQPVAIVNEAGDELRLVAFFPVASGKRLQLGMSAQVTPLSVEANRYGTIRATVVEVSVLPETQPSLVERLQNEPLVQEILQAGPVIKATIALETDPDTFSGLKWSSTNGPPLEITPGTSASVTVTIEEQRPIELIIPFFKAWYMNE